MNDMNVIVNGVAKSLNIVDANGINWTQDFIGNWGALSDGQFTWDEEVNAYRTDEETYTWWQAAIEREVRNEERIAELKEKLDAERVLHAVSMAAGGNNDLEDIQRAIAAALDELEQEAAE